MGPWRTGWSEGIPCFHPAGGKCNRKGLVTEMEQSLCHTVSWCRTQAGHFLIHGGSSPQFRQFCSCLRLGCEGKPGPRNNFQPFFVTFAKEVWGRNLPEWNAATLDPNSRAQGTLQDGGWFQHEHRWCQLSPEFQNQSCQWTCGWLQVWRRPIGGRDRTKQMLCATEGEHN